MIDERTLLEKLRKLEALFAGAASPGEQAAAGNAIDKIRARLEETAEDSIEFRFSMHNPWSARLLMALLRRHGIEPYRYPGQRRTTIMARASRSLIHGTLWPLFEEFDRRLQSFVDDLTNDIIRQALWGDDSDATVHAGGPPGRLPAPEFNG